MMYARIAIAITGFLGAIFWIWYIPALCIVLLSVRFRAWEAIALGVFMDLLWLAPGTGFHSLPLFTILSVVIVWLFEPLRTEFLA